MFNNDSQNNHKIEEKIMTEIKSGRVKLRSKYIFLAERLGLGSAIGLSIILAILFFNLTFFYLKATDNLQFLSFGRSGLYVFLESFPYLFVAVFIICLMAAGYFLTKSDFSYKKPLSYWGVGLVFFVMFAGSLLAFTDLSEKIEQEAYSTRPTGYLLRPFFEQNFRMRGHGVAGIITQAGDNYLMVQAPHGEQKINISEVDLKNLPTLISGQFVVVVGERRQADFWARDIRVVNEATLPMTRRGIIRRFGPRPFNAPMMPHFSPPGFEPLK